MTDKNPPLEADLSATGGESPNTESTEKPRQRKKSAKKPRIEKPYARAPLEEALDVPRVLKEKNGGNPWEPAQIAKALGLSKGGHAFFYRAAASRDFGLTEGSRDTSVISLTELGRELVYAPDPQTELNLKRQAFLNIDVFRQVLNYYKGSDLPEMKYLGNTLQKEFGLHPETHEEFSELFRKNCEYLEIGSGFSPDSPGAEDGSSLDNAPSHARQHGKDTVVLAEPQRETGLKCFVAMPFKEKTELYQPGFFDEILKQLIVPAGQSAGFTVSTANRQGTDVIQSTIINDLIEAELVVVDLSEHNPNVLFELGLRIAFDKPVALIRAVGTSPIFDVDNMLRVYEYDPRLWPSTVQRDLPKLAEHIKATWQRRDDGQTFLKLLKRQAGID